MYGIVPPAQQLSDMDNCISMYRLG